jgi:hypothetical protein
MLCGLAIGVNFRVAERPLSGTQFDEMKFRGWPTAAACDSLENTLQLAALERVAVSGGQGRNRTTDTRIFSAVNILASVIGRHRTSLERPRDAIPGNAR